MKGLQGFAPEARWIRPESLHLTLKFIGEQPVQGVDAIADRLQHIEAPSFELKVAGHGFFPTAEAARVFWTGVVENEGLTELAMKCEAALAELGIPREGRPYSPHLTLARDSARRSGSPKLRKGDRANSIFTALQLRQDLLQAADFGAVHVREFVLYRSQLSPEGSLYTKLRNFPLQSL